MKLLVLNETAYDEGRLEDFGIQFAIYYYESEPYSGLGQCLAYKDKKWYTHDLGHCSCYGPFDSFSLKKPFDTLKRAVRDLHMQDWSNYYGITIERLHEEIKLIGTITLFSNGESDYVYLAHTRKQDEL